MTSRAEYDDVYRCVMCGIHMFNLNPAALAKHARHTREFEVEVQRKVSKAMGGEA